MAKIKSSQKNENPTKFIKRYFIKNIAVNKGTSILFGRREL